MKNYLLGIFALLFCCISGIKAQTTETLSASAKTLTGSSNCTITGTFSSNRIKLVKSGGAFSITAKGNNITKMEFSWRDSKTPQSLTVTSGSYASNVWTGDAHAITFTNNTTTEVAVIQLVITYGTSASSDDSQQGGTSDDNQGETTPSSPTQTDTINYSVSRNVLANQMVLSRNAGSVYYNTTDIKSVDVNDNTGTITVMTNKGNDVFHKSVNNLSFAKAVDDSEIKNATVNITEAKGWFESVYAKWELTSNITNYNVYIKGGQYSDYTAVDKQLVRKYPTYGRVDVVGLKTGTYSLKVVPVSAGVEGKASEVSNLTVLNYDRTGYAHFNRTKGVGAYNNDGTLKDNAIVLYVTNDNINTISYYIENGDKAKTPQVGLGKILQAFEKNKETRPLDIRFIGEIKVSDTNSDQLMGEANCLNLKGKAFGDEQNITYEGIGDDATMNGIGFRFNRAGSVEVRNLGIMNQADDCFELTQSKYMWIHHVDMYYGNAGSDKDQAKGDGSTDTKKGSTCQTFAYNHYWDCGKASLCGLDGESTEDYITYHHNWFDHSDSRHPRVRVKTVHVYNNYYDGNAKYGVGSTLGSSIFVEANYYRNCKFPMMISLQGNDVYAGTSKYDPANYGTFSKEAGGMIKSYNNKIVDTNKTTSYWPYGASSLLTKGNTVTAASLGVDTSVHFDAYEVTDRNAKVPSSVKSFNGSNTYNNFDTDNTKIYSYTADAPEMVPEIVEGYWGAGRLNHGDVIWNFSDDDDKNYDVDASMKSMLHSYKTTLVGFFE